MIREVDVFMSCHTDEYPLHGEYDQIDGGENQRTLYLICELSRRY